MSVEHHRVEVVRIPEILPHPNADKLEIVRIKGYQAIVAKDQFKAGDLAYYIPPDSVVPESEEFAFLWLPNAYEGGVPERKRRIAAKKLRGEWSEGLLMPTQNYGGTSQCVKGASKNGLAEIKAVKEGDDVAGTIGIYHYNPPEPGEDTSTKSTGQKVYPRTLRDWWAFIKGWFRGDRREQGPKLPVYDVKAYKHFTGVFQPGETVLVTEKIHGCNARYSFEKGLFGKEKFYVGSRQLWKSESSQCVWRAAVKQNPWIETWCRQHPGYALYGEVVSPKTQKGYAYGTTGEQVKFFLFDVRQPDGTWMKPAAYPSLRDKLVPILYFGVFDETLIKSHVDGSSAVPGAKNIREGVVIRSVPERRVPGVGRAQLKLVSNAYLEKSLKEAA